MIGYSHIVAFISEGSNLVSNTFWLVLQLSSRVGQTLVNQIVVVLNYLNQLFSLIITLLRVLCEDSLIFFRDLGEKSSWLAAFIANGISHFADGVTHVSSSAVLALTKTTDFLCESSDLFISVLWSLISLVKMCVSFLGEGLLLIGSSIWLAVTKTPTGILDCIIWILLQLHNALSGIIFFLLGIKNAIITAVKDCLFYVSKIPCSSYLGLIIGLILLYSSMKNYRTLFSIIFYVSRTSYLYASSICYNLWNGHIFRSARQENCSHVNSLGIEEKLCIICQDRLKEVILMPCRHVCLCIQCSLHIARNHRYCPICRSHIQSTMKVYI